MIYCDMTNDCDIAVAETRSNLVISVRADHGRRNIVPRPDWDDTSNAWDRWYADVEPMDHPDAGEVFRFTSRMEAVDKLLAYREEGTIRFPDTVTDAIVDRIVACRSDTVRPAAANVF